MNTDESQTRALVDDRVRAMRAKDAEPFLNGYAAETVTFELAPPLAQSSPKSESQQVMEGSFASKGGTIGYEIRDLTVAPAPTWMRVGRLK